MEQEICSWEIPFFKQVMLSSHNSICTFNFEVTLFILTKLDFLFVLLCENNNLDHN